jgi:hypothetical protein
MTISMYKASVPIFVQFLTSLSAWLDKAAAYAEAKKIDPAVLLNTRLFPDMFPLARQVRAATDHAINACGRLAGVELPTFANTEASFPELEERVAKTIEFIKAIKPAQIDGSEDKEITMKFASGERKFSGQSLLLNFCLPNFYFHATTAYDILRQSGVELGKRDFMGTPPQLWRHRCALTRRGLNLEATYEQSALSRYHSRRLWRQPVATHRLVYWAQPRRTPAIGGSAATRW